METYLLPIVSILAGFALLIWSSDVFVDGAADLARHFGISPILVGMLVIGFGTSAPEMLVSGVAAFNGNPDMGIGNGIGSNITNITLVLGVTALFYALPVESRIVEKELPLLLIISFIAMITLYFGEFGPLDGAILLITLAFVLTWMIYTAKKESESSPPPHDPLLTDIKDHFPPKPHNKTAMLWTIGGLLLLLLSSQMLVWGASSIAVTLGVSDLVIGLTIVAIGTSLPELAATLVSAKKGETDLAIGNIVGSNFFNTLGVLALPAIISPGMPDSNAIYRDMPIALVITTVLLLFAWGCWQKRIIKFGKGAILLSLFFGYQFLLFYQSSHDITCRTFFCL
ncbi:MAG: calcium/sodium antiporter [Thiotrichaceae bacterium]